MLTSSLSDMLTRIRNGYQAKHATVKARNSKLSRSVCDVLAREGYIRGYTEKEERPGSRYLSIELKYHEGRPALQEVKSVSTPGMRIYKSIKELPRVYNGLGIFILSTPQGVLSDNEAREQNVGGEVLCQVF